MSKIIYHWHHIIPCHAGGTDDPSNLIQLTIEEHAEAHRLLWEQHGRPQDKLAWLMLSGKTEEGEKLRIELARSPESRAKMSESQKYRWTETRRLQYKEYTTLQWQNPEFRKKTTENMSGIKKSEEHCQKIAQNSAQRQWKDESREKIGAWSKQQWNDPKWRARQVAARTGKHHSEETRAKMKKSHEIRRRMKRIFAPPITVCVILRQSL